MPKAISPPRITPTTARGSIFPCQPPPPFPPPPLQMQRRQTQNLTPPLISQLLPHNTIHTTPNRLATLIDQHTRIVVELHHRAVLPLHLLRRAHNHGVSNVASSHFVGRADGDSAAGLGTEVALFLDDDDDAVAWGCGLESGVVGRGWEGVYRFWRRASS